MSNTECPVCFENLSLGDYYLTECCAQGICKDCVGKIAEDDTCPKCRGSLSRKGTVSDYIETVEKKSENFEPESKNIATMAAIRLKFQKLRVTVEVLRRKVETEDILKYIVEVNKLKNELINLYYKLHFDILSEDDKTYVIELMNFLNKLPSSSSLSTKKKLKSKKKSKSGKRRIRSKKSSKIKKSRRILHSRKKRKSIRKSRK